MTYQSDLKRMHRQCVETCPTHGFLSIGHQCTEVQGVTELVQKGQLESFGSIFTRILNSLSRCWGEIVGIGLLAFLLSSLVVVSIRFAARFVVLTVIFGTIFGFMVFGCWLAYKAASSKDKERILYGFWAFVVIVFTIVLTLVVCGVRKKIPLVIGIFKEASKALADIPSIVAVPILVNY